MKYFIEKLEEYGLKMYLDTEEINEMAEEIFQPVENRKREETYFKKVTDYVDLNIDKVSIFKEKFDVPSKYDFIPETILEECVIEESENGNIYLDFEHICIELEKIMGRMINESNDKTFNENKKFQFKKKFNPEQAEQELIREVFEGMSEIMEDEQTKKAREKFLSGIETALISDRDIYLVSN